MAEITANNIADVEYLIGRAGELFSRHTEPAKADRIFDAAVVLAAASIQHGAGHAYAAQNGYAAAKDLWDRAYGS